MTKPTLPELPSAIRTLTNDESSALRTEHGELPGPDHCVTCGGTGVFRWWSPGTRSAPVEWECQCVDQWVLRRYLLYAGVGLTYARLGWLDYSGDSKGSAAAAEWLEDVDYTMRSGVGLTLYGTHGTGKTLIGALLLKGMLALGYSGYMTTFAHMIDLLADGWRDSDAQQRFIALCKGTDVLLLDDIGQERHEERTYWDDKAKVARKVRTPKSLARSSLDEVLRYRLSNAKVTIITTNRDPQTDFAADYSEAIGSLVLERSHLCRLEGDDFRRAGLEARLRSEREMKLLRPVVLA